jgi:hypothetical protein
LRVTLNSGEAGSISLSFSSSSWMRSRASGRSLSFLMRSSKRSTSASLPSFSRPSSFLIALSCSRRKNSRCCLDTFSSICLPIRAWMCEMSISRLQQNQRLVETVANAGRFQDLLQFGSAALVSAAAKSASRPGSS